jgi:hypothetical protein
MKTLTIRLPDALDASLAAEATSRRRTKSAVVRQFIETSLDFRANGKRTAARPSLHDRLKKYQTSGPTGIKDLASNPAHLSGYGRK